MFSTICLLTEGEAKVAARTEESGIAAYQKLHKTYSRSTLAKTVRMYKEALIPKKATIPEEVIARITEWEGKIRELEKQEGKDCLKPKARLALLTEICRGEIRDMIYQTLEEKKGEEEQTFKNTREKIITWVSNRVASNTSVKKDRGVVDNRRNTNVEEPCGTYNESWDTYEEIDVNMTGACYSYGGIGHPSKLCPSQKGQRQRQRKS